MKTACKVQCPQCPFRPKSLKGWLGSYTPEQIAYQAWRSITFFCHTKINYENNDWLKKANENGKICLGSLAFANKMMAPLRKNAYPETDPVVIQLREEIKDRKDIECMGVKEFIEHHKVL